MYTMRSLFRPPKNRYAGERHIPMFNNGRLTLGNYFGPGTDLSKRLKTNDIPINNVDKASKAHDIRYGLADNTDQIRVADKKFISRITEDKKLRIGNPLNNELAQRGMQAKLIGEKIGILRKGSFFDRNQKVTPEDKSLMTSNLKKLEQEGYGYVEKPDPPGYSLIRKYSDVPGKGKIMKKKEYIKYVTNEFMPKLMSTLRDNEYVLSPKFSKIAVEDALMSKQFKKQKGDGIGAILFALGTTAASILVPMVIDLIKKGLEKRAQRGKGLPENVEIDTGKLKETLALEIAKGLKSEKIDPENIIKLFT